MKAFQRLLFTGALILGALIGLFLGILFAGRVFFQPFYHRVLPQVMQSFQVLIGGMVILGVLLFYLMWHQRAH